MAWLRVEKIDQTITRKHNGVASRPFDISVCPSQGGKVLATLLLPLLLYLLLQGAFQPFSYGADSFAGLTSCCSRVHLVVGAATTCDAEGEGSV
jgi:hypothetical protein